MSNLLNEYSFKGQKLKPFSKARLSLAMAAGVRISNFSNVSIKDIFGIVFLCLCDQKTAVLAQIDRTEFWIKEGEWEDATITENQDILEATELVQKLLQDAVATRAEPSQDSDFEVDSGN